MSPKSSNKSSLQATENPTGQAFERNIEALQERSQSLAAMRIDALKICLCVSKSLVHENFWREMNSDSPLCACSRHRSSMLPDRCNRLYRVEIVEVVLKMPLVTSLLSQLSATCWVGYRQKRTCLWMWDVRCGKCAHFLDRKTMPSARRRLYLIEQGIF